MTPRFYRKEGWETVFTFSLGTGEETQLYAFQISAKNGQPRIMEMTPIVPEFERPKKAKVEKPAGEEVTDAS